MRQLDFNHGWRARRKSNRFAERAGLAFPWVGVTLPHDSLIGEPRAATNQAAGGYVPSGTFEYEKVFDAPNDDVVFVEFEGVYRDAVVHVNDEFVIHEADGYTEFRARIDHLLRRDGTDKIRVEARTHDDSRWYTGAGIYRNVSLRVGPSTYVDPGGVWVTTPDVDDKHATVRIHTTVVHDRSTQVQQAITTTIVDSTGVAVASDTREVSLAPRSSETVTQQVLIAEPRRWSIDSPTLYTCTVRLHDLDGADTIDEASTTFGVRTISVDTRRGFRLNGVTVKLRGACVHHDNGVLGAATIDRAEERRVELLKAAGFNALRSAHQPMSRAMLRACDRVGIVVMDEISDIWTQAKADHDLSLRFAESWPRIVEAMVRKDRNHPCVVMYCTGNEIPEAATHAGRRLGRELATALRSLDPNRLVTQAVNGMMVTPGVIDDIRAEAAERNVSTASGINTTLTNIFDMLAQAMSSPRIGTSTAEAYADVDVAGYNYMPVRFESDAQRFPNRVIVGSETHPTTIGNDWPIVLANDHVIGDFTWTGFDYLGESGIGRVVYEGEHNNGFHGEFPWFAAWCGDLDITGHRRPVSYYREIVFGRRTDPYIAVQRPARHGAAVKQAGPWSWTDSIASWTWGGFEGKPIVVETYADADEVELFVNDSSVGRVPIVAFRASFDTTFEPGFVRAVAWRNGVEVGRSDLQSAGLATSVRVAADRSSIRADSFDAAFVTIELADADGRLCTDQRVDVVFEVDGPGVLAGSGSADPKTEERYVDAHHSTFDGRALAVVRPTGVGEITVRVSAEGFDPVAIEVHAVAPAAADRLPAKPVAVHPATPES